MAVSNSKSSAISNAIPRSSAFLRLLAGSNSIGIALWYAQKIDGQAFFVLTLNPPELAIWGGRKGARRRSGAGAARGIARMEGPIRCRARSGRRTAQAHRRYG